MGKIATGAAMLLAGLAGAGLMLMFAPVPGKKVRARMLHRGMDLRDDLMDRAEDLQADAQKALHEQNRKLSKEYKKRMEDARDRAEKVTDTAQKVLLQTQSQAQREAKRRMDTARSMAYDVQGRGRTMLKQQQKKSAGLMGRWSRM